MYDLTKDSDRRRLASKIREDIDSYCQTAYADGPRSHLGASLLGDPCMRKLWYTFRWVKYKKHSGRLYRLFNRGHKEEARFCEWLRGIDVRVREFDDNGDQFRFSGVDGHFGGSLDGIADLLKAYNIPNELLLEFKTSCTGAIFNKLLDFGVKHAKPVHFAQMSIYGMKHGFKYALYMVINKNDDNLHVEIVELDHDLARDFERKAAEIINSQEEPPRLHENQTHFDCKYCCDYRSVCWDDDNLDINCRSCKFASPVENGEWYCAHWQSVIPNENIQDACDHWKQIC